MERVRPEKEMKMKISRSDLEWAFDTVTRQLDDEKRLHANAVKTLQESLQKEKEVVSSLRKQIKELRESVMSKHYAIGVISGELELVRRELADVEQMRSVDAIRK